MDSWEATGSERARAEDHEAVRTAEQTVSDAWIGRLLLAETEAGAVLGACARVRERAAGRVRAAQRSGDLSALVRSQTDLEQADAACRRALEAHEHARDRLAREHRLWAEANARRARPAPAGRSSTGRR